MRHWLLSLILLTSFSLLAEQQVKKREVTTASATILSSKSRPFRDKDLKSYLKKNPAGVIYVVSPGMYLSLKGLEEYKKITKSKNLSFLPLLDPLNKTPSKNILNIDLSGIRPLQSQKLVKRNALIHFPSFLIYKSGRLLGSFNPGYDPPEKFAKRLEDFFE